jgi:prophage tail gpP-like protein
MLSQSQVDLVNANNDLASRDPSLQTYSNTTGLPNVFPGLDDVAIQVGATRFQGWQSVSITRSCEMIQNSFTVTASVEFMQAPAAMAATRPGTLCSVYIGADLVLTGRIDRRTISADAHNHQVTITGRDLTRNLVDCSADLLNDPALAGGFINAVDILDLAQKLCNAFGLKARSNIQDTLPPIPGFQVGLGETSYSIIESAARYCGVLVYADENANVVFDRIGNQSMASGFTMPGNIEAILAERALDLRFSHYTAVWNTVAALTQITDKANQRALVIDGPMSQIEYRPRIIVVSQNTPIIGYDLGLATANWELARRYGRSQGVTITCDSWRDTKGSLWKANTLVTVDAPNADISNARWVIGTVVFRKDAGGTHADLVILPPEAFSVEPNPLNLLDAQIAAGSPTSQNPRPPSTATSGLAVDGGTI